MKFFIFFMFFATLLTAQDYPKFFEKLGTPLFKADISFQALSHLDNMQTPSEHYHKRSDEVLHIAVFLKKDPMNLEMHRKRYVKELRSLQKEHDKVMKVVNTLLIKSIDGDDYKTFSEIINVDLTAIRESVVIRKRVMAYYVSHRTRGKLEALEEFYVHLGNDSQLLSHVQSHLPRVHYIEELFSTGGEIYKTLLSKDEKVAFLANGSHCFKVIDIADTSAVSEIGSFEFPSNDCSLLNISLSSDYQYAYLSDIKNGFAIIDISQESEPIVKGKFAHIRALASAHSDDNTINFVIRKKRGLSIMDTSNEEEPKLLANYSHGLSLNNLMVDEKNFRVYLTHSEGLTVIDISIIGNPRKVAEYKVEGGSFDIVLSAKKEILYLASGDKGVQVLDIGDDEIKLLSTYQTPTSARSLNLNTEENTLFISALEGGVSEVNTLDPLYLKHLITYKVKDKEEAFSSILNRAEDKLFISYGKAGLAIIEREKK